MATARVDYDPTTPIGKKIALMLQFIDQARSYVGILNQELTAFAGDTTSLAAKSGIASGSCQAFLDQMDRMNSEFNGTMTIANYSAVTATSYVKTIADRMA